MELNDVESLFFDSVLRVELGVPINAVLSVDTETIEMVVVPKVDGRGRFIFEYSNASPFSPEVKDGVRVYEGASEMFGRHPLLERAWLNDSNTTLTLRRTVPAHFKQIEIPTEAKVDFAGFNGRGRLSLSRDQIIREDTLLTQASFSLVNFPDFIAPQPHSDRSQIVEVQDYVRTKLPEGWELSIRPPVGQIVLDTENGWVISIAKEVERTRGLTTHRGLINKSDGSLFNREQLIGLLKGLNLFFQFVTVDHLRPTTIIGFDCRKRPVWGQIDEFHDTPRRKLTWFENNWDAPNGAFLEILFRKFWRIWTERSKELEEALNRYVQSEKGLQSGNLIGAIAESFAGLETLASLVLRKTIKIGESKKEIDRALSCHKVPHTDVRQLGNPFFKNLCDRLNEGTGKGVYLLNDVRNYSPHPLQNKTAAEVKTKLYDALHEDLSTLVYLHDLSQFYFEHLMLHYCGYPQTNAVRSFGAYRPLIAELNAGRK